MNKIDRVIKKYGLDSMGSELERRWIGKHVERMSTRELADYFNREVLRAAINEHGAYTITSGTGQIYEALATDESGDGTLVRSRLQQQDIDIDAITNDFVTHQTIFRYLKKHRGVSRESPSDEERKQQTLKTVNALRGRMTAVTEQMVTELRGCEGFSLGTVSVLNDLQILCEDCGRSYSVDDLIEANGCECGSGEFDR